MHTRRPFPSMLLTHFTPSLVRRTRTLLLTLLVLTGLAAQGQTFYTVGTGTDVNDPQGYPTPFANYYEGQRAQYLYRASEMTAAGLTAGNISHLRFTVTALNSCPALVGYTVKMKHLVSTTTLPNTNNFNQPEAAVVFTTVYGPATYTPVVGANTLTLSTPFNWNGTQNVLVEICSNNADFVLDGNASVTMSTVGFNGSRTHAADNATNCTTTGANVNQLGDQTERPNIQFGKLVNCNTMPAGGTVPASYTVCPNGTTTITAADYTANLGIQYQWQVFSGGTWVNAAGGSGATTTAYTTPAITVATQYRLRTTCLFTSQSATSNATTVTPMVTPVCYCGGLPTATTDNATGIRTVVFGDISSATTAGPAYNDLTSLQTTVATGQSYPMTVQVNTAGNNTARTRAWIDWDRNLVFDASEMYDLGSATNGNPLITSLSPLSITVPGTATPGTTIMRVRTVTQATGVPAACGNQNNSEAEDYTIVVCSPPAVTFAVVDDCEDFQFGVNVLVSSFGGGSAANIEYTVDGGAPVAVNNVPVGTTNLGPFAAGSTIAVSVNNGTASCAVASGALRSPCPKQVVCGNTLMENYCYGNSDTRVFSYLSNTPGESVTLSFVSGTMAAGDVIRAYSGSDNNGTPIPGLTGNFPSLAAVTGTSNPGEGIYLEIESDGSNSCADGQQTSWQFEVECTAGCVDPEGAASVVMDCINYRFSLDVEVYFAGDVLSATTTIEYAVNGGAAQTVTEVSEGSITTIGPFAMDDNVAVRLLHDTDSDCNKNLGSFTDDNSCPSAENCVNALNLAGQTSPLAGTTVGRTNDFSFVCGGASANTAPDAIYFIDVPANYQLRIRQQSNNYDSQHYVRYGGACPGTTAITCLDATENALATWDNSTGSTQRVYWIQDGWNTAAGTFVLEWQVIPSALNLGVCGQDRAIPDNGCATDNVLDAKFTISGQPTTLGTNVGLESVDLIITHSFRSDLQLTLITPGGQQLSLINARGGSNSNFGQNNSCPTGIFKLRDTGTPLANLPNSNNTVGTWAPEQPLAGLTGNPNGEWTLRICDGFGSDVGLLRFLRMNFQPIDCNGVLGGIALPGTICNDGNACTINDVWSAACACAGTFQDTDGDGTCNANDGCPSDPLKIAPGVCGCGVADVAATWYADADGDGFGDPAVSQAGFTCQQPVGYVANSTDNCLGAANPDQQDSDSDGAGDACDTCPNDADNDIDGDGICGDVDGCPTLFGEEGSPCQLSPGVVGVLDGTCQCVGANCTTDLVIDFSVGSTGVLPAWEMRTVGNDLLVASGASISLPPGTQFPANFCTPDGEYYLVVNGAMGTGGGYVLRTSGNPGTRIIDNTANYASGTTSQVSTSDGVQIPVGTNTLIYTSCDKYWWKAYEYIVANEDTDVSAQFTTAPANSGYEFWIFDPNGSYSFRKFRTHSVSDGFGPNNAVRACHMKINNWAAANAVPQNVLLNVRVRGVVAGAAKTWGPACRFVRNDALAACPPTKLMDIPGNPYISCNSTRAFVNTTANRIHARPVSGASKYQFRFSLPAEGGTVTTREVITYYTNLGWPVSSGPQLLNNVTYDVTVRAMVGGVWCAWGEVCKLTICNTPPCNGAAIGGNENSLLDASTGGLRMWPNPNRGDQLFLGLDAVEEGVNTITVDLFDMTGKRVIARTYAVNEGSVSATVELGNDIAPGMYLVNIAAGTQRYTERLVVQH